MQHNLWGLSPGPGAVLSRAGSNFLRHLERCLSRARRWDAAHVRSVTVRRAHVDPELLGSLKSQGFRSQCECFCLVHTPFAASHLASRSASKVPVFSQLGCRGSEAAFARKLQP